MHVILFARRTKAKLDPFCLTPVLRDEDALRWLIKITKKEYLIMKTKVILLLHLFGLDVLLLGLIEKLLLGLSKRVAAWKDAAASSLNRCKTATGHPDNCV